MSLYPGFRCTWCAHYFEDGPPLIVITGVEKPDEDYCSDTCAYDAGWSKAVVTRWESEARNGVRFIVYARPAYLENLKL